MIARIIARNNKLINAAVINHVRKYSKCSMHGVISLRHWNVSNTRDKLLKEKVCSSPKNEKLLNNLIRCNIHKNHSSNANNTNVLAPKKYAAFVRKCNIMIKNVTGVQRFWYWTISPSPKTNSIKRSNLQRIHSNN